jgi:hypothetical protein
VKRRKFPGLFGVWIKSRAEMHGFRRAGVDLSTSHTQASGA